MAIQSMNNNKSPGIDIPQELYKKGRGLLLNKIQFDQGNMEGREDAHRFGQQTSQYQYIKTGEINCNVKTTEEYYYVQDIR
jgi:hypothetical protein